MTTYVYETMPKKRGGAPRRFEVRQSMRDEPLKRHPETGEPVRRVIAGGYGIIAQKGQKGSSKRKHSCDGNCGCCCNN